VSTPAGVVTDKGINSLGRRKQGLLLLAVVIAVALLGGLWWWNCLRTAITTDNAKVAGDIVDVSARTSGLLVKVMVKEGQSVKAGQVLAELDDSQAKISLSQAEAALEIARANTGKLPSDLASAQAAVTKAQELAAAADYQARAAAITRDDAQRQYTKMMALFKQGALSEESLDQAATRFQGAVATAQAQRANAASAQAGVLDAQAKLETLGSSGAVTYQAQLKQAQAAFDNARWVLDNTQIKSLIDGTVVRVPVQIGENVVAGQSIITVADLEQVWVSAYIQEKQVSRVRVGQAAEVRIDAYPGRKFTGQVEEIGEATQATFALIPTESTSGNFTKVAQRFPVKIRLNNQGAVLKPGMSSVVKIVTR